jgi:hypothetical protein
MSLKCPSREYKTEPGTRPGLSSPAFIASAVTPDLPLVSSSVALEIIPSRKAQCMLIHQQEVGQ